MVTEIVVRTPGDLRGDFNINIDAYSDALVVLGTADVVVPVIRRWGSNPILGGRLVSARWSCNV